MSTTTSLAPNDNTFDFIIAGGGTAGCVVASRLSSYLPDARVLLIEGGPSDYRDDKVLKLKEWLSLLGTHYDYDYGTTEQPMGNSYIRHSRAKVLGGCSSHNTLISFRPFKHDCDRWVQAGCAGWDFRTFTRLMDRLRNRTHPVHRRHRNQLCIDWVQSSAKALDIPVIGDFNEVIAETGNLRKGAGFFNVSYNPDDGRRSSASVAYIHPILKGEESRHNLTVLTDSWVSKINLQGDVANGLNVTSKNGEQRTLNAKCETVLSCGAVDTPRLMLLSGLGPRAQLEGLGIPLLKDIPGVGENLIDHPETVIMWELNAPVPSNQTTMDSDAGVFLRREPHNANGNDEDFADIMMHCYQIPFTLNTNRLGYDEPENAFCMTPNIPRARSRGKVYLTSTDPNVKPALDFRYFTDPEGYDADTLVAGIKAARRIAQQAPFKDWLKREVAPGPEVQSDEDISLYARRAAHTVYHPSGTTKMGDISRDEMAVVDPELKVRGIKNLRIADGGIFPFMPSINPMLTTLGIGERCAELLAESAGWKGLDQPRL